MKANILCLFSAGLILGANAAEYSIDAIVAEDRYESAAVREGNPELVKDIISPGLLVETGMGVYRTADRVRLGLGRDKFALTEGTARVAHGIRIYDFGRSGVPARLEMYVKAQGRKMLVTVSSDGSEAAPLKCAISGDGVVRKEHALSRSSLPADVILYLRDNGEYELAFTGLADSSAASLVGKGTLFENYWIKGYGYPPIEIGCELVCERAGATAEVRVDNHFVGAASPAKKLDVPCIVKPLAEFDPVKAGWPLVFADEFEGSEVDWSKWYFGIKAGKCKFGDHLKVKDGILHMEMNYGPDGKNLEAVSLRSKPMFKYGYFESRLKLTKQNGWWAAFWMYGRTNSDPFVDGFEIDIFEDYYTRKISPDGKNRRQLDHNLHMNLGSQLKSWNYSEDFDGELDDWLILGCKRTPFEISYYLNGKLIRSCSNHANWTSVTFDAFSHATGNVPLCLILSQQVMSPSWTWFDKTNAKFPEDFVVDYVRAYAMPDTADDLPRIAWKGMASQDNGKLQLFTKGEEMKFEVAVEPAKNTGAAIKAVYLFDAGYMIGYKCEPPYEFDVTMSPEWYGKTAYMKTGRQKVVPDFACAPHSFVAYVQDERGAVADTGSPIRRHPKFFNPSTKPFEGKAQTLPGKLTMWKYDEGGEGVAYHDTTKGNAYSSGKSGRRVEENVDCTTYELASIAPGEWVNYTVDIAEAGDYRAELAYGTAKVSKHFVHVVVDGQIVGSFEFDYTDDRTNSWSIDKKAVIDRLPLPAGRHVLSLYFGSQLNIGTLSIGS